MKIKLISVLTLIAAVPMTQAADILWNDGTADYTNAADWVGGIVPGANDNAINDNGTNNVVRISAGNPDWNVNQIRAGNGAGNGAFAQGGQNVNLKGTNGGSSFVTPFRLGVAAGDTGVYTLNGGSINYSNGGFNVGELGTGILNINGGTINGTGNFADNIGGDATPSAVNATVGAGTSEGDFTWFQQGYAAGNPSAGLPAAGSTIISQAQADHSYNLPPSYTANNSVLVASNVTSATITLTAPATCTGLSFLATAGVGPANVNYTVHHADTTTETGSLSIPDWFGPGTAQEVMAVAGRVDALGQNFQFPGPANGFTGNAPYLWSLDIPIADTGSAVTSIDLSYVSGGFANVFGLSSQTTGGGPFSPVAITGFNKDVVVELGAVTTVPNTVTDIVNQTAGSLTVSNGGQFFVGNIGTAIYNLGGGSIDINNFIAIGRSSGNGTFNMTGGTFNQDGGGNLLVATGFNNNGNPATGVLNQSGGTINSQGQFLCPENSPSTGTYNLSGTGALIANTWIAIGRNGGTGTLNMTNGSITKLGGGGDHFDIGGGGPGVLNQYGGVITNTTSDFWVGESAAATWNMNGGAAYLGQINICVGGSATGTLNLNGGTIQTIGIFSGSSGATVSTLSFNGGTLQAAGNNPNFITGIFQVLVGPSGATIDSQNFSITIPEALTDNGGGSLTKIGTGTLTLSGANTYAGTTMVNAGALDVGTSSSGGGAYTVANNQALGVTVQSANGQLNTASFSISGSTMAMLNFDLGNFGNPSSAPLNVIGTLTASGNITINIADALPQLGQFPLIKYGTLSGTPSFTLGALPTGVTASLVNDTANNSIDLNITGVNAPRWDGQAGGNWDIGLTTNWVNIGTGLATFYTEGSPTVFDDNAAGTTTVNLTTTVHPASVTVNVSNLNYTFVGTGSISGAIGLNKKGSTTLTIGNNNSYTGPTVISGGTLSVSNLANGGSPSSIGASSASPNNLIISGGTFSYAGAPVKVNRGYQATNGVIDAESNFTLTGPGETLSGTLFKTGPATMTYADTGSNVLSPANIGGAYQVQNGTVILDGSAGPQTNSVIGEMWVGSTPSFGGNLILTNTSLGSSSWFAVGRGSGAIGNTSSLLLFNSALSCNGFSAGFNNGLPNSAFEIVTLSGNSTITNRGGNTSNLGESQGSSLTMTIKDNSAFVTLSSGACAMTSTSSVVVANSGQFIVAANSFRIGDNAGALSSMVVQDNAHVGVNNNFFDIANGGATGTMLITNNGSVFVSGDFNITDTGTSTGTLTMWNNAIASGNTFLIGKNGGTIGTVNLNGGSAIARSGDAWIGGSGSGTMNQTGGTMIGTNWISIGRNGGGTGVYNLTGGTLLKVNPNGTRLNVAEAGTGTLNISGAGNVVVGVGGFADMDVCSSSGSGTVNLNGGTITAGQVTHLGTGTATFNFNGGALIASSSANSNFMSGLTTANVQAGGAIIDSSNTVISIAQPLLDAGGGSLTKLGSGTLRLNGANTYTGVTLVNAGTLGGTGTIAGPVGVSSGTTLFPGGSSSLGTLSINNFLTLSNGSTALFRINNNGNGTNNDLVSGLTGLAYAGSLVVTNSGTNALVVGSVFQLFNSAAPGSGNFSSVTVLPAGSGTFNPATGQLTITGNGVLTLNHPFLSGGNLVITGNGSPGTGYTLLTSTNIALPLAQWATNTTGTFNGSGASSNAIPLDQTNRFFLLRQP